MSIIPASPNDLGISGYPEWRKGQRETVEAIVTCRKRHRVVNAPTGSGKSLIAMAVAKHVENEGGRTLILTSSKQLQDQIRKDFPVFTMKGKANYPCEIDPRLTPQNAMCVYDPNCEKKLACEYFKKLRMAPMKRTIVTNYAMGIIALQEGFFGEFTHIICDEAHDLAEWVIKYITAEVRLSVLKRYNLWNEDDVGVLERIRKADSALSIHGYWNSMREDIQAEIAKAKSEAAKVDLTKLFDEWVKRNPEERGFAWELDEQYGKQDTRCFRMTVIDFVEQARNLITERAENMIYLSATNTLESMASVGVYPDEAVEIDLPCTFPRKNRPVYFVPTIRVDRRTDGRGMQTLVETIDEIIEDREDHKGLILPSSYRLANEIKRRSRYHEAMILHSRGEMNEGLQRFINRDDPCIFLSPAAGVGVDLAHDLCRYLIIPKVPLLGGGGSDSIVGRRKKSNPDWYTAYTFRTLIQNCGRGMRAADDWCETFILDNHWFWIRNNMDRFCPDWFTEAVTQRSSVPKPLSRLFK